MPDAFLKIDTSQLESMLKEMHAVQSNFVADYNHVKHAIEKLREEMRVQRHIAVCPRCAAHWDKINKHVRKSSE